MQILKVTFQLVIIILLTIVTQVGGIVYLISIVISKKLNLSKIKSSLLFLVIYFTSTLLIVPFLASLNGRANLPLTGKLRPHNILTCLLNRHYADHKLVEQMERIANKMNSDYPGARTNYLDANFPFIDGFPLTPHLSHNDGKKIDLAFFYENEVGKPSANTPSFSGYGIYEAARPNELNTSNECRKKGFWQYDLIGKITLNIDSDLIVDEERTRHFVRLLAKDHLTQKVFLEPHLKARWGLAGIDKIRFHGCQAVRHDDHIHTQIQ